MSERKDQPAMLKKKIARLEALLAAEKEASQKAFDAYRETLYELVEAKMALKDVRESIKGVEL